MAVLTVKQKRFCVEYIKHFNAAQAARTAGYSLKSATVIGCENLMKPDLKEYIKQLLDEAMMSEAEVGKRISDLAKGNLNEFMEVKMVERTPRVRKSLKQIIAELEAEIQFEEEFSQQIKMDADRLNNFNAQQNFRREQVIRYGLLLKKNPKASMIVDGTPELVEDVEINLAKLSREKEKGTIKSIAYGPNGPKIELYAADAALVNLAKIHGMFEKDNKQGGGGGVVVSQPFSDNQVEKLIHSLRANTAT